MAKKILKKEKYSDEEIEEIVIGYQSINKDNKYSDFLKQVSQCDKCMNNPKIKDIKIPINKVANPLKLEKDSAELTKEIKKNYDEFNKATGNTLDSKSLSDDQVNKLKNDKSYLKDFGFSIGLCGWTDTGMLGLKGKKPQIMFVGKDWYPLSGQESFICEKSIILQRACKHAEIDYNKDLIKRGIYFTNAMLCYRGGSAKKGNTNISQSSFENCNHFLIQQIEMIKPKIIISFGIEAAKYCCLALKLDAKNLSGITDVTKLNANDLPIKVGEISFFPLHHFTAYKHQLKPENYKKAGDYIKDLK
jgi:uracil-DNA glycosylase